MISYRAGRGDVRGINSEKYFHVKTIMVLRRTIEGDLDLLFNSSPTI